MSNPHQPRRIALLASGQGSTFAALLAAIDQGRVGAEVVLLASNKPECGAVNIARERGIPIWAQPPAAFAHREAFDAALFAEIDRIQPELILCAGYLRIIGATSVERWIGRMINLHPSLLPAYPGLHTHARVIADGVAEHGASVHFVSAELDGGPLIAQVRIAVRDDDDAASLAARLRPREHALLVAVTRELCANQIACVDGRVQYRGERLRTPLQLDDANHWCRPT